MSSSSLKTIDKADGQAVAAASAARYGRGGTGRTRRKPSMQESEAQDIIGLLVEWMRVWNHREILAGKPSKRFCQQCGRSNNVRLHNCNRCGTVYFCRDKCKMRAFSSFHKGQCAFYRARFNHFWPDDDDGSATKWRPKKSATGNEFNITEWEASAARPFVPDPEEPVRDADLNGASKHRM